MKTFKKIVIFLFGMAVVIACMVYVPGLPGIALGVVALFFTAEYVSLWLKKMSVLWGGIVAVMLFRTYLPVEAGAWSGGIAAVLSVLWVANI